MKIYSITFKHPYDMEDDYLYATSLDDISFDTDEILEIREHSKGAYVNDDSLYNLRTIGFSIDGYDILIDTRFHVDDFETGEEDLRDFFIKLKNAFDIFNKK